MTKDSEWIELYKSRYVNDRVEDELIEFKEEIDKKFKISKCKGYQFPRKTSEKKIVAKKNDQPFSYVDNSLYQNNDNNKKLQVAKTIDEENKIKIAKPAPRS